MPSLEEVVRSAVPGAVELAAGTGIPGSVNWVRVMRPRVPAFDALEPGDIAVVPETALVAVAHDDAEVKAVADDLRRADVAGVIVVTAPTGDGGAVADGASRAELAASFVKSAARAGLAVFRSADSANGVERAVIRFLVNDRAEIDRQVGTLETALQAIALAAGGIQEMVAAIATFLHRAVAVEDADARVVAVFAPPDPPGSTVAAARYEAHREPVASRTSIPGGGSFVLIGEGVPSELERVASDRVVGLLALEIAGDVALRRGGRRAEALPAAGPPWVVFMARQSVPGDETSLEMREEQRHRVTRLAPARRLLLRGDAGSIELRAIAAAVPDDPLGLELARRVADVLGRPVAVSRRFDDPSVRPQADAEARALLEAADEMAALETPPSVLRADRLSMYRLLGSLHNLPDGPRHARALLAPVLKGSPGRRREQLATLRALVDGAGPAQVAAALGVHRNTVAYRVRAIEGATGWDLSDPDLRLTLSVALRIVQNDQI